MIKIRIASHEDIKALHNFYASIGRKEDGYFEECLDEQSVGNRKIFLALAGDQLTGYVMLNFRPRYSLYKKLEIPEIQDLNVAVDMRRQGIGRLLVEYCEKECGAEQIGISVGLTKDYGAAQRLYVAMGYKPDGYGVTYNREAVSHGDRCSVDDDLCLMMVKEL